jgi:site-specific DNA recombinase
MQRLRKVIDLGGLDRVYAVALDRITRNMHDAVVLLKEFDKAGVELRLVHQPDLDSAPNNRLLRHMLAAFAEFEREMIASRVAETRSYLKKHGRRLAGKVPYGYDADPATKQLVENRSEARRVRAIFRRAADGQTPSEIAQRIDHLGWRTKEWTSGPTGKITGGGRWTARQIISVLRNPVYLGQFAECEATRPGCHEAIVAPELCDAARKQLDSRRSTDAPSRRMQDFPLRGKIICPKCKRPLSSYVITKTLGPQAKRVLCYYRCRSTAGGRPPCKGVSFPAWEVEDFVRRQLGDHKTWEELAFADARITAKPMAALWQSLDLPSQMRILAQVVERIEFGRKNTELRITFTDCVCKALTFLSARS